MSNQLKRFFIGLLFVAGLALLLFALKPKRGAREIEAAAGSARAARPSPDIGESAVSAKPAVPVQLPPLATPKPDEPSLHAMLSIFGEMVKPGRTLEDLLKFLESTKQEPFVVQNKNKFTGEMAIVRTKSPLPNTRYLHAQFFTDENGVKFLQHLSFEYKASPTAFTEALQTVHEIFPELGKPMHETAGFSQWAVADGYVVWCKKLVASDLVDNPFNAYTNDDLGTVRCATELNPHPHDE